MGWEKTELSKLNPLGEEGGGGGWGRREEEEGGGWGSLSFQGERRGSGRHQSNIKEAHRKTD